MRGTGIDKARLTYMLAALVAPALLPVMLPATAQAQVALSITIAPPELPVYEQPPLPAPDYIWVPGYWAYGPYGYYWVPGTWVLPPQSNLLWTPGYWGWTPGGVYIFHTGYWGPYVGFYGGVNYGFGYSGHGFEGGRWQGGHFFYNTEVNRIGEGTHITNVYRQTVVNNVTVNRVSFNGGQGGLQAQATPQERAFAQQRVSGPTPQQRDHRQDAIANPELRASVNRGRPPIAATPRPGQFEAPNTIRAQGAEAHTYQPPVRATAPHPALQRQYDRQPAPQRQTAPVEQQMNMRPAEQPRQQVQPQYQHQQQAPQQQMQRPQPGPQQQMQRQPMQPPHLQGQPRPPGEPHPNGPDEHHEDGPR